MRLSGVIIAIGVLVVLAAWAVAQEADAPQPEVTGPPLDTGLVERSGVSLMLLDVEVTDRKGRPIPGLTAEDFYVELNGDEHPIYSLDDLCTCPVEEEPPSAQQVATAPQPALEEVAASPPVPSLPPADPPIFILYLDFSQLRTDGRDAAVKEARRWVRETMQPGDRVQLLAYASLPGLKTLTDFTSDKQVLLDAIDATDEDKELLDPFPIIVQSRIETCSAGPASPMQRMRPPNSQRPGRPVAQSGLVPECCVRICPPHDDPLCMQWADEDYENGKHAMEALERYVVGLERMPGRKTLLFFHQNARIFPERCYRVSETRQRDMVTQLDQLGAEANLSRTVIYPTFTGDSLHELSAAAVNFGANLADFTGGKYNRGGVDLTEFTSEAGRSCACLYRIGLRRPEKERQQLFRAKITVRDRVLNNRYRVQFLDEVDRWWRAAQAVLADPAGATDVHVRTALLPRLLTKEGWTVEAQVLLDVDSLTLFRSAGRQQGDWEVGALLALEQGKNWEMLGISRARRTPTVDGESFVLHKRSFSGLKPGSYEIGSFVRDRAANAFGGSKSSITLPKPGRGLAGPILMIAERPVWVTDLPLWTKKRSAEIRTADVRRSILPPGPASIRKGESLELLTWICSGRKEGEPTDLRRYVSGSEGPLFRFEPPVLRDAGLCYRLTDHVETAMLEDGPYTYHVRWGAEAEDESTISFVVAGAPDPARPMAQAP